MYEAEVASRKPILFALSTCPRCERLKNYLSQQGIDAIVVDVDLLPPAEKQAQIQFVRHINPRVSFPTLVVGELAVIGEDYDDVREALGL